MRHIKVFAVTMSALLSMGLIAPASAQAMGHRPIKQEIWCC
jgi:hypothetical protein